MENQNPISTGGKGGISLPSDLTVKPGVDTGPKVGDGISVTLR